MQDKEVYEIRLLLGGTVQTQHIAYMLGVSILTEHLRVVHDFIVYGTGPILARLPKCKTDNARYLAVHEAKVMAKDAQESLLFLQGTGLEILLEDYGLAFSADSLRDSFFSHCEHVKACQNHQSKSA